MIGHKEKEVIFSALNETRAVRKVKQFFFLHPPTSGGEDEHQNMIHYFLELCRTLLILTTHSALLDCKQQRARVSTSGIRQLTPLGLTEEVFTRASRLLFFGCEERKTSVIR